MSVSAWRSSDRSCSRYDLTSHGRKTLFDRLVKLDPGGLHVKVASNYERNAPLRLLCFRSRSRQRKLCGRQDPLTFRNDSDAQSGPGPTRNDCAAPCSVISPGMNSYPQSDRHRRGPAVPREYREASLERIAPRNLAPGSASTPWYTERLSIIGVLPGTPLWLAGECAWWNGLDSQRRTVGKLL